MKTVIIFTLVLAVAYAAEQVYTTKYDNINVDQILGNNRLLDNYIRCLLDKGRCTPDGQELKRIVPDAITDGCAKCNPKQTEVTKKVIRHIYTKRRADWEKLIKKYDPQNIYQKKYAQFIN